MAMPTETKCRKCDVILTDEAVEGICPKCLLAQALQLDGSPEDDTDYVEQTQPLIGRYRLIHKIGEGGLGVVFMAEQLEPVKRRVAMKLIKPGMDSREVVARFEVERQALALMDHPNIAKVFDGGSTPSGRPYFVMEWVQGIRLTDFCDQNKYSLEERLQLFIQVCLGIQHAHQKGVIHRDIKPSNILISLSDGMPTPKIIDFGIAKATEFRLTDKTFFTHCNQFLGTPAYMSPEHAVMGSPDIDTRSDIYSLGVLMHELLVGTTPFRTKDFAAVGLDEMRRIVREEEPPRASECLSFMPPENLAAVAAARRTDPAKLMKAVRGDLDWIVMRCLEKDRNRRYETADALASDIHRHLKHEPIIASPPSKLYQFNKLVRRNKLAFGAAAATAVALLTGITLSMLMFFREHQAKREQAHLRQRAEDNEKRARTQTAKSDHVAWFLKDMLKGVGPRVSLGRDTRLLTEILDETAKRLKQDLRAEPEVQADLLETLGTVYVDLGQIAHAETIFRDMLAIRRTIFGKDHPQVARSLNYLGDVIRGRDRIHEAVAAHREALEIQKRALGEHPDIPHTLHFLGWALGRKGNWSEAEGVHRQALAMRRKLFGNLHSEVADSVHYVAEVLEAQDKVAAAEMLFREALAIQTSLDQQQPELPHVLQHLGRVLGRQNKMAEAEAYYREALAVQRGRFGESHPDVARSLRELGAFLSRVDKVEEGEATTRQALAMFKQLLGDHPEVVQTLEDLTKLFKKSGQIAEATGVWREIISVQRNIPGNDNLKLGKNLQYLGSMLEEQGLFQEAEAAYREAFTLAGDSVGIGHVATISSGTKLARFLEQQRRPTEAEVVYSRIVQPFYNAFPLTDAEVLSKVSSLLSTCNLCSIRDGPKALHLAQQAVEAERDSNTLAVLAAAHAEMCDFAAAASIQRQAIDMLRDKNFVHEFKFRLRLYEANTPYRVPLQPPAMSSVQLRSQ